MEELIETFEILIDAWVKSDNKDITVLANSLIKQTEKALIIDSVSNSIEYKERIEAYKECFETYIPTDKWDEATLFLSTYGSGLAKDLARKER